MSDPKQQATQRAARSLNTAIDAINRHGRGSPQEAAALGPAVRDARTAMDLHGATAAEIRAAAGRPA